MRFQAEEFWLPKGGSREAEYEDACKKPQDNSGRRARFAVADGATEGLFSKQWATQLVRAFVKGDLGMSLNPEELKPLRAKAQRISHRRPLPWYAEEKAERGAFASLLGLEVFEEQTGGSPSLLWKAVAVGDSCLFHVRHGQMSRAWPIASSAGFGNTPDLLCSKAAPNGHQPVPMEVQNTDGTCGQDSAFYLMTDALSCWFLRAFERGEQPWLVLADLGTNSAPSFGQFVGELRATRQMKNDDVTLLRVDIHG